MEGRRETLVQLAVAILGIIAVGSAAFGVVLLAAAPGAGSEVGESVRPTAILVLAVAGFLAIAFGALAAVSAWLVWTDRPLGRTLAFAIVVVVVLTPAVAAVSGGFHPALLASVGLGVVLAGCLVLRPATAAG